MKIVLITGATDGLGKRVARDLAERGATVLLHGRSHEKGEAVLREIRQATVSDQLTYYNADFSSLDEVRRLAEAIQTDHERLDLLINNAGIGFGEPDSERQLSRDGYELRFQVNYLAGFLLTLRLLPLLRRSETARVVNVASAGQQALDFDDLMLERGYSGTRAYRQSKLAQVMFTLELAERLRATGITVNALHPATFMDTNMVREADITPHNAVEEGAEAVEHLASSPELADLTGRYFDGKQEARADGQAYDEETRRRLWDLSEELTGIAITEERPMEGR